MIKRKKEYIIKQNMYIEFNDAGLVNAQYVNNIGMVKFLYSFKHVRKYFREVRGIRMEIIWSENSKLKKKFYNIPAPKVKSFYNYVLNSDKLFIRKTAKTKTGIALEIYRKSGKSNSYNSRYVVALEYNKTIGKILSDDILTMHLKTAYNLITISSKKIICYSERKGGSYVRNLETLEVIPKVTWCTMDKKIKINNKEFTVRHIKFSDSILKKKKQK